VAEVRLLDPGDADEVVVREVDPAAGGSHHPHLSGVEVEVGHLGQHRSTLSWRLNRSRSGMVIRLSAAKSPAKTPPTITICRAMRCPSICSAGGVMPHVALG
jgi:hypothetical protein